MAQRKPVTVCCPKCGNEVGTYDGRSSMNLVARCKHCRRQVVYDIKTKKISTKPIPARTTSSGVTF